MNFISNVRRDEKTTLWTLNGDEDGEFLLEGHWLEYYVYQIASAVKDNRGKPLFDECSWGVEDRSGKEEIDFIGIFGGQITIASCKTEPRIKHEWFKDLRYKAEQLGKEMCSTLLISTVSRESRTDFDLKQYSKWAEASRTVLVLADDFPELPNILKRTKESPRI